MLQAICEMYQEGKAMCDMCMTACLVQDVYVHVCPVQARYDMFRPSRHDVSKWLVHVIHYVLQACIGLASYVPTDTDHDVMCLAMAAMFVMDMAGAGPV